MPHIAINISQDLLEKLDKMARDNRMPRSTYIKQLIISEYKQFELDQKKKQVIVRKQNVFAIYGGKKL